MKVSYNWLATYFENLPSAEDLADKLTFHAFEIEGVERINDDTIIDIDVLPNRSADSLSHRGIAREISTLFNIELKNDPLSAEPELAPTTDLVNVSLNHDASCIYYAAARISGVKVDESPEWLKERLNAIGQKSINNVVDATNYVLFNLGQPTHVFDAQKFSGETPHVGVRLARNDEELELLTGEQVTLTDSMTVITDADGDTPIAVAGVKGGTPAEVTQDTTDIIIESAKFDPVATRKTAQTLKIRTDASARYENDVPDKLSAYGVCAVANLIIDIAGGTLNGYTSTGKLAGVNETISVRTDKVTKLLGAEIKASEIEDILIRLGCEYKSNGNSFTVTPPFERKDIRIPEDVIEEIGRVYGYNKIESKQLDSLGKKPGINKKFAYSELIRTTLSELGFSEVYTYSLRDHGEVALLNSLASDKDHLRENLNEAIDDMLSFNERQAPLLGKYDAIRIFEIGNVFPEKYKENTNVCIGVRSLATKKRESKTAEQLGEIKEKLEEALGASLPNPVDDTLEFSIDSMLDTLTELHEYIKGEIVADNVTYTPASQYPFVLRDVALWVSDRTTSDVVLSEIMQHAGQWLVRVDLFDEFTKDGKKSYAFHLVFQSYDKTLTDDEVGAVMQKVEDELKAKGWEVR